MSPLAPSQPNILRATSIPSADGYDATREMQSQRGCLTPGGADRGLPGNLGGGMNQSLCMSTMNLTWFETPRSQIEGDQHRQ